MNRLTLLGAGAASAAAGGGGLVTLNAAGTYLWTPLVGASLSYTGLTIAAGSNIALVVSITWDSALPPTGIAATWDGVSMTRLVNVGAASAACELWGLANPAIGNKTLAVSWTGSVKTFVNGVAFNGVDQSTPFPHTNTGQVVTTIDVTSAVGNLVMAQMSNLTSLSGLTGTTVFVDNSSGAIATAGSNYDSGAASVAIGDAATLTNIVGIDIKSA